MLPNIYKGNFYLAALLPLLLIFLSLYQIFFGPGIKLGVDFIGGTLITMQTDRAIDGPSLAQSLEKEGLSAKVGVYRTTYGYKVEVEMPQAEEIQKAERLKERFNSLMEEVASLYHSEKKDEYEKKKGELEEVVKEALALAGMHNQTSGKNLNELSELFTTAYQSIYRNYEHRVSALMKKYVPYTAISVQSVSPALSLQFIEKAKNVVILSVIISIVFVFVVFRNVYPSLAVLSGAFSDIIIALGAMATFGIPLTLASFAALIMLIGYSLDTDVLLTMRMLKRKGDPREKAYDAMKTGISMSTTSILAFTVLYVLAYLTRISTYYEISSVVVSGLVGDIFATWGINAVLLLHYLLKEGITWISKH